MARSAVTRLPERSSVADPWRAAGGILLRPRRRGRLELAVVHRPARDDWSLPKGKVERGETLEDCAVREVFEETGYLCVPAAFAGTTRYLDRRGRAKVVAYWFMDPARGTSFTDLACPQAEEVDELRWMELAVARRALTYEHDRALSRAVNSRIGSPASALLG